MNVLRLSGLLAATVLVAAFLSGAAVVAQDGGAAPTALPLEEAWEKAQVDGKYRMLLRQFKVEGDWIDNGEFRDVGPRFRAAYAGQTDLPNGHWVYVYPYWYIWRELSAAPVAARSWGPEQVTGPPDTLMAGDVSTAWASRGQDDQQEWLLTEYERPVTPAAVMVHETYNPGALIKVSLLKLDGEEVVAWEGKDPIKIDDGKGVAVIPVKADFPVARVKVYFDSPAIPGWNEIDAIGLRDDAGVTHWATACEASSTYAQQEAAIVLPPEAMQARLMELEGEVSELRDLVGTLQKQLKEKEADEQRMKSLEEDLKLLREELRKGKE